ncbi:MAG TPA: MarR family transcriptional regulator [Mycobacteriales bacterium]|nr:MarR family transcriptional regulator [Mycobacteriales bacterium]
MTSPRSVPAAPAATHPGYLDRLGHLERVLFTVGRTIAGLRVERSVAGQPVDRAGLAVLGALCESGALRLSEVASRLGLDVSTVSRQVRALEDRGWLTRAPDPDDRRAARLAVSDPGRAVLRAVRAARCDLLDNALQDWTDRDLAQLTDLLTRLSDALGAEPAAR